MHRRIMKNGLCGVFLLLFCLLLGTPEARAETKLRWQYDGSLTGNDLSGPGQRQSSLTEGIHFFNTLELNGSGKQGEFEHSFNIGLKLTDDRQKDTEKVSLTNLRARLSNRIHTVNFGDTFEAFSRYSLNSAVKGLSYHYLDDSKALPELTLVSGMAYSRWDNFWGNEAVERKVYGARLKQNFGNNLWAAINAVQVDDSDRQNGSELYDGSVISLDWEYRPIMGLILAGESSFSSIDEDNLTRGTVKHSGYAHRFEAIGDGAPSRVVLEYERVSPDYLTVLGSATADREKAKASWRYDFAKDASANFGFLWYRDNLEGQLAKRTDHYRPEIGMTLRQVAGRRYATATLGYKFDRSVAEAVSTSNHFITAGYRDRFGQIDSNTNIAWTTYDTTSSRNDDEFSANTSLSSRHTLGDWILKPSVNLGVWQLENQLANLTDRVYEYSFGLGMDRPKSKLTTDLKLGQHRLLKDGGDDSQKYFASLGVYYRPAFLASFDYGQLYLRGLINDYSYSTSNRDYRENSLTVGIKIRF